MVVTESSEVLQRRSWPDGALHARTRAAGSPSQALARQNQRLQVRKTQGDLSDVPPFSEQSWIDSPPAILSPQSPEAHLPLRIGGGVLKSLRGQKQMQRNWLLISLSGGFCHTMAAHGPPRVRTRYLRLSTSFMQIEPTAGFPGKHSGKSRLREAKGILRMSPKSRNLFCVF